MAAAHPDRSDAAAGRGVIGRALRIRHELEAVDVRDEQLALGRALHLPPGIHGRAGQQQLLGRLAALQQRDRRRRQRRAALALAAGHHVVPPGIGIVGRVVRSARVDAGAQDLHQPRRVALERIAPAQHLLVKHRPMLAPGEGRQLGDAVGERQDVEAVDDPGAIADTVADDHDREAVDAEIDRGGQRHHPVRHLPDMIGGGAGALDQRVDRHRRVASDSAIVVSMAVSASRGRSNFLRMRGPISWSWRRSSMTAFTVASSISSARTKTLISAR